MRTQELKAPEAARQANDGSPAKWRRQLHGDLDNIVLKTLRKEPERRYASVEQLMEDIRRHLHGLPVTATPDSMWYRGRKFVRRNKIGVAAIVMVVLAVVVGVASTVREAHIAAANERRAQQRFNDVRKLANSLMFEIHDSIRDLPGSTPARRLIVTRALEYLDGLNDQSQGDTSLQKELAAAYERVGDVLGYPYAANLGDWPGALQSYRKALAIRESLAASASGDAQPQLDLAADYFKLAQILEASGDFTGALDAVRTALPITQKLAAAENNPARADQFAGSYYFIAGLLIRTGDPKAALENYRHAAAIREAAMQSSPGNLFLRVHLAADFAGESKSLEETGDLAHAVQTQARAISILQDVSRANSNSATLREYLGEAISRIAFYRLDQGNPTAGLEAYRQAHKVFQDLLAADSKDILAKSNFAFTDNGIASSLVALHEPTRAIKVFREAIARFEEMSPRTAGNRYPRSGLAESYSGLGTAYAALAAREDCPAAARRSYWEQARASCEKSFALWDEKQKLGELESGERREAREVAQCIAKCNSELGVSKLSSHPH
jgi:eukaryotic-like serine/threonine-protein kinase